MEYDGTRYHGFQLQDGFPTIQGETEEALWKLTGERLRVMAASRTDAGVHAKGQVVSFRVRSSLPLPAFINGLNHYLSRDIAVKSAHRAGDSLPGCPPHPDWFVSTVASVLIGGLPKASDLDELLRPKAFYGHLIHENCPRRAYYDEQKFAKKLSDPGCLYELGCKGPVTHADCPTRMWNHGTNWCVASGGMCLGCASEGFPDWVSPLYQKTADVKLPNIAQKVV